MTIESKTVEVNASAEKVYAFASNFENYTRLVPSQLEGWSATEDTCTFKVGGFMQLSLRIVEKVPCSKVCIAPDGGANIPVPLNIILLIAAKGSSCDAHINVDVHGSNPMINMMIKPKIKEAVDRIVDQLQYIGHGL